MPSVLLTESLQFELGGQEPWPSDVKLFQPYEVEQILMPDNANCLAVQAFLHMCNLDFQVEPRHNAEYMSPSGRVPFIKCGAFVVAELDPIIAFVNSKGVSLTNDLDSTQKADMRAYMSLVNTVLANAELYVCWCDKTTLNEVTKSRYGSVFPWPLNHLITWQKKNQVVKRLGILGWTQKTLQDVYKEVEACCSALSERLDSKEYFFGNKPTDLDAVVYGHLYAILTGEPKDLYTKFRRSIIAKFPSLRDLVNRIDSKCFSRGGVEAEEFEEEEEEEPQPEEVAPEEEQGVAAPEEAPPPEPETGEPPAAEEPAEAEEQPAEPEAEPDEPAQNEGGEEVVPEEEADQE